jgi:hypothetical protein
VNEENLFILNSHLGHLRNLQYFNESSLGVLFIDSGQVGEQEIYANSENDHGYFKDYFEFLNILIPNFSDLKNDQKEKNSFLLGTCFDRINVFVET